VSTIGRCCEEACEYLQRTRIVSLETGKPLHINDEDCEVSEPMPVSDEYIQPNGTITHPPSSPATNGMLVIIPVVRITASIKKTLKSRTITAATLNTYDEHFKAIMASYPDPFAIHSTSDLDPRLLTAACALQTSRFLLYRHNLSPACRRSERRDALDRLVSVAQDTALYTQRSFNPNHMSSWAARVRTMAPAFFCGHIWRCILVLTFRAEYAAALTLIQVSAAVGDLRQNNMACGRHLNFFLDKLIERLRAGATREQLENDEEMLAYVSGDMQGASDNAWVWTGSEPLSATPTSNNSSESKSSASSSSTVVEPAAGYQLTERELHEWPGWDHIQRMLAQLLHESQRVQQQQQQQQPPLPPPTFASQPPHVHATPSAGPQHSLPPFQPPPPPPHHHQQQQNPSHLAPAPMMQQSASVSPAPGSSHSHSSGGGTSAGERSERGSGSAGLGGTSSRISIQDIM